MVEVQAFLRILIALVMTALLAKRWKFIKVFGVFVDAKELVC